MPRLAQRLRDELHNLLRPLALAAILAVGDGAKPASASEVSASYEWRTNLVVFHNARGQAAAVRSASDWRRRRREIQEHVEDIMGALPNRKRTSALETATLAEVDCGTYLRRKITYVSEPGNRVPAFLLVPKAALDGRRRWPGVLALHPTDMEFGNRVVVEPLRKQYAPYAAELAERGFVVIAPAYPLMADYQPDLKALGYQSGSMKAIWDNLRAMDLLDSLPYVRKGRYGVVGHSLGGHNAIFTAVFDDRIKLLISSCGFDSFVDYYDGNADNWQPGRGWCQERYMPRLAGYRSRLREIPFDFPELIGCLAPRPVFINAPIGDTNFRWRSVDAIVRSAAGIYHLYKVPDRLQVEHPECGHEFPPEVRERAYRLLTSNLR